MLDAFIAVNRADIINRCRAKAEARSDQAPPRPEVDCGVPVFLNQLLDELRQGPSNDPDITRTAMQHGRDLLEQGYSISEVVHNYGDVCQAITELALERRSEIDTGDFRTLNRCLDNAIAGAVTEYTSERDVRSLPPGGGATARHDDAIARDLFKVIQISKLAYETIRSGKVGPAGSTGAVLTMGLDTALGLAERLLTEK